MDVESLNRARTRWQFRWFLEGGIDGVDETDDHIAASVDFVLRQGWAKTGVEFVQVGSLAVAHIVLRLTDAAPPAWPNIPWGPGWYYRDDSINKNVAQVSARPEYFRESRKWAYLVGMEMVGHGCFRMWDMYTAEHAPYLLGVMGDWEAALANSGLPTPTEIECAKAWLRSEAVHVHDHPEFTVPTGAPTHEEVPGGEHTHGP
jgi:hypothetical protein